jgi:hypothetical protein
MIPATSATSANQTVSRGYPISTLQGVARDVAINCLAPFLDLQDRVSSAKCCRLLRAAVRAAPPLSDLTLSVQQVLASPGSGGVTSLKLFGEGLMTHHIRPIWGKYPHLTSLDIGECEGTSDDAIMLLSRMLREKQMVKLVLPQLGGPRADRTVALWTFLEDLDWTQLVELDFRKTGYNLPLPRVNRLIQNKFPTAAHLRNLYLHVNHVAIPHLLHNLPPSVKTIFVEGVTIDEPMTAAIIALLGSNRFTGVHWISDLNERVLDAIQPRLKNLQIIHLELDRQFHGRVPQICEELKQNQVLEEFELEASLSMEGTIAVLDSLVSPKLKSVQIVNRDYLSPAWNPLPLLCRYLQFPHRVSVAIKSPHLECDSRKKAMIPVRQMYETRKEAQQDPNYEEALRSVLSFMPKEEIEADFETKGLTAEQIARHRHLPTYEFIQALDALLQQGEK